MCMCMRSAAIDVSLSASPLEVPISFATFLRVYLLHLNDVCVCYFVCVRVPRFLLLAIHLFLPFRLLPFRFFPPFFLLVHLVKELFPLISRPFFVFVFWRGIVHIHSPAPCCDPLRRAVFHFLPFSVCRFVRVVVRVARIFLPIFFLYLISSTQMTNEEKKREEKKTKKIQKKSLTKKSRRSSSKAPKPERRPTTKTKTLPFVRRTLLVVVFEEIAPKVRIERARLRSSSGGFCPPPFPPFENQKTN